MDLARTVVSFIETGSPQLGWVLSAYLLWRLHQITDRQYKHIVETAAVLAVIKTLLISRAHLIEVDTPGEK